MNIMPAEIVKFLQKIKKELPVVLKDNLYGIYVFGSLTYGGFRPKSSDIDCVAVTNKILSDEEFDRLEKWYKKLLRENYQLAKRLEMSYAVKNNLFSKNITKTPKFFKGRFNKKSDSDANNPITWLNIKNNGLTVFGPEPKAFVPAIDSKILKNALKTEFDYINRRLKKFLSEDWSKVYVILTFCRILYTLKNNKIATKKRAAEWCLKNLPRKYHPIILAAIKALVRAVNWKNLRHPAHGVSERSLKEIMSFKKYVSGQVNKK